MKLTLGILAHVDAGKTTLTEALLLEAGVIRKAGRVDNGDAFLDTDALEKQRGITIYAKQATFCRGGVEVTLLDTPGHVDFSAETERVLQVLDAAVLVISGTSGVQSHTETLYKLLVKHGVPVFFFVNKTDMPWLGRTAVLRDIREKLTPFAFPADTLENAETWEDAALGDETLMEKYLSDGRLTPSDIRAAIARGSVRTVFFGSALKNDGVADFLDSLLSMYTEPPRKEAFAARVFKISRDEKGTRLAHMKLLGGRLRVKDVIDVDGRENKIDGIRIYSGAKCRVADEVTAGDVCAVTGADDLVCGTVLGELPETLKPVLEPVLSYKLVFEENVDPHIAFAALKTLEEEDPTLRLSFDEGKGDIRMLLMGQVQTEVLRSVIQTRFGYNVTFGAGDILYRETIADTVEGVGHYEPLRHYAEVHLLLEPGEPGSGVTLRHDCDTDALPKNFQRLILTHLAERTHKGTLIGAPLTDVIITLCSGRASKKHTEGGDFREATYRAVRQGLMKASGVLLEPWYSFEIAVPTDCTGRLMTDVGRMGGSFSPPETADGKTVLRGEAPVGTLRFYPSELTAYTHGVYRYTVLPCGFRPCHNADEVISASGYDPDTDISQPCDSVFCEGGAGFLVKWYDVEKYMHLESVLQYDPEKAEEQAELAARANRYAAAVATDKELMEIFERTYGKIRPRAASSSSKPRRRPLDYTPPPPKKAPELTGDPYLLIDGYNVIFAVDALRKCAEKSLDTAREELIRRLCNYQGFYGENVILVFDAYRVRRNAGETENFRNIHVVYTKTAETADTYIERVSGELVRKKHRVRVATSDGSEQMIILGSGALRVPAAAFYKELTDAENAIKEALDTL